MSTDLEVHPTLLMAAIHGSRGGAAMISNLRHQDNKENNTPTTVVLKKSKEVNQVVAVVDTEAEEENPITPTSEENKIPAPKSPPPAPRKRRFGVAIACRKKLDFLEQQPQLIIPKEEEIQEFFASSFEQIHSRRLLKRRCPCV